MNWLMLRYPLEIALRDRALWENAADAGAGTRDSARAGRKTALKERTPEGTFEGSCGNLGQRGGLSFLLANPRTLLADEMGSGKTVQALACLAATGAFPALIVVPPSSAQLAGGGRARFLRIREGRRASVCAHGLEAVSAPEADVYIIHYLPAARLEAGAAADGVQRGDL